MPADPELPRLGADPDDTLRSLHETAWRASPDPQAIVRVEHDPLRFRLVARNPAAKRLTGMPQAATRGRLIEEVYPPRLARLILDSLAQCMQAGRTIRFDDNAQSASRVHARLLLTAPAV